MDFAQVEACDLGPVIAFERALLRAFADRAPDDDLVDPVLLDVDDVDGAILRGLLRAGVARPGLQRLVARRRLSRLNIAGAGAGGPLTRRLAKR
jgi:hypothetical protein